MKMISLLWQKRRRPPRPTFNAPHGRSVPCPDCDTLSPPCKNDGHYCPRCGIAF